MGKNRWGDRQTRDAKVDHPLLPHGWAARVNIVRPAPIIQSRAAICRKW
jgi:hypothetical protein